MNNIYKSIEVSSGGSLIGEIDTEALLNVCKEWSVFKDNYICDCNDNGGKDCKHPDKYKDGGCY